MRHVPQHEPPHVAIERRRNWNAEADARKAVLEAKYGIELKKIPTALTHPAPTHPRKNHARRYDYRVYDRVWRIRSRIEELRSGHQRNGWRTARRYYLAEVERVRQAEIEVRKLRTKRTGCGKPRPKNAFAQQRLAIETREFREKNW